MEKKSKYDTNPLNPDFPRQARETGGSVDTSAREADPQTQALESEAPTRQFDLPYSPPTSYPSVFVPPQHQPPAVQPPQFVPPAIDHPPTSRHISGINLPENVVQIVPYLPFYLGAVAALLELYLVPRTETRVRFHAAQGLAIHLLAIAVQFFFLFISNFTGSRVGSGLFTFATIVFLVVSMFRVWKGKPHHIKPFDEATKWLNEKVEPRK